MACFGCPMRRRLTYILALAELIACMLASRAFAQSCALYATDFGAFSGPPDLLDGEFRVLWCPSGASITSSNFCPTGNAFKLDSSSDDPVILVTTGSSGCTAIEITLTYAQYAASGTVVRYGTTNATTISCAASTPNTLGALVTTGGVCTTFSATIPLAGMKGVFIRFDHGSNSNALTIDDCSIRRVGCCASGGHPCCETGAAGCADAAIANCVCATDPFCCSNEWDAQCIAEVTEFGCGSCDGGAACLDGLSIGFGTLYSGGSICSKFPEIFERCEGVAPFLTSSLGCATSSDMALRFSQGYPYSAAITRCVDFAERTSPALAFRYSKTTGTLGPKIDVSLDGASWTTAWSAPISFPGDCAPVLLDLASIAGEPAVWFRFTSGSSVSNLATFDDIELVEIDSTPHDCCTIGTPGCQDKETSACVCALDAYCCETEWDELCTAIATVYCNAACPNIPVCGSSTAGSCFVARNTPACADATCCRAVCDLDAYCCETEWDAACAAQAIALCATSGDVDGDGVVGAVDLAIVLNTWGQSGVAADVDGSGSVDAGDLAAVLSNWST